MKKGLTGNPGRSRQKEWVRQGAQKRDQDRVQGLTEGQNRVDLGIDFNGVFTTIPSKGEPSRDATPVTS